MSVVDVDVTLRSLIGSLDTARRALETYDMYYEGQQPIRFLAPALQKEFGERISALVINWPAMVADAVESRLDVEGFRYAGDSSGDKNLWAVWQANDLDEQSQQGHLDAVALSRSYVLVGSGDAADDAPIVTIESPLQVFARRDPRTRKVKDAVKRWDTTNDAGVVEEQFATLYVPGRRATYINDGSKGWRVTGAVDEYDVSIMPVVPLVNRPRILRPDGRSEFYDVIPIADAANKFATDMMVSGEYHAMPRRWASGVKESDFQDAEGNPINAWSRDAGTLWATENAEASFGQFTEAELTNFHNTIKLLGQIVVQLTGLPPHYGLASGDANPTSADAIRSSESQLVKRVERKQTAFGGSWEDVMRLILRFQTGAWDTKARSLETIWRDPATPTRAQMADATLKLATPLTPGGRAIVPIEQAREDLGYTPEQRRRMAEMDREAETDPYLQQVAAKDAAVSTGGAVAPTVG